MKKLILGLLMGLFMAIAVPCQAWFHDNASRWMLIDSGNFNIYCDVKTMEYDEKLQQADLWLCYFKVADKKEYLQLQRFDLKKRRFAVISRALYDKNGKILCSENNRNEKWQNVIPGTNGEEIYEKVKVIVKTVGC